MFLFCTRETPQFNHEQPTNRVFSLLFHLSPSCVNIYICFFLSPSVSLYCFSPRISHTCTMRCLLLIYVDHINTMSSCGFCHLHDGNARLLFGYQTRRKGTRHHLPFNVRLHTKYSSYYIHPVWGSEVRSTLDWVWLGTSAKSV